MGQDHDVGISLDENGLSQNVVREKRINVCVITGGVHLMIRNEEDQYTGMYLTPGMTRHIGNLLLSMADKVES